MVIPPDTDSTDEAVELVESNGVSALGTYRHIQLLNVSAMLSGMLLSQVAEEYQYHQIINSCQPIEEVGTVKDSDLDKDMRGEVYQVEEYQEDGLIGFCWLLYLVHYLCVAGYPHLFPYRIVIVENSDQLRTAYSPCYVNRFLVLFVRPVTVNSLHQHALDDFLVVAVCGQHERSLALMVGRIPVDIFVGNTQQIGDQGVVTISSSNMQGSVALNVG